MNNEFCELVTKCISLVTIKYPEFKEEILKAEEMADLSEQCQSFIKEHQDEKKNNVEIEEYINKF